MAPELFDSHVSYGTEVDVWAFGSLAYEVATGLPPNATTAIDPAKFGTYLKQHVPRLEGDQYSSRLKDLVAYCMIYDPKKRPPIELVQIHPYIYDTEKDYPTASLSKLVNAYRLWESQGGNRQSLFSAGGAQGPVSEKPLKADEEWDFNADDPNQPPLDDSETQAVYDVYGSSVDLPAQSQAPQSVSRRRRKPPPNLPAFKAPLEKVFDPNTISNYHEHVRDFYQRQTLNSSSDLPLRDNTEQSKLRESLIDLDASLRRNSQKAPHLDDLETIRPAGKPPPSSGMKKDNRRTQDWTFPVMSPLSPEFDHSRFISEDKEGPRSNDNQQQVATPRKSGAALAVNSQDNRVSTVSLIDLDASLTPPAKSDTRRPSTADSDGGSVSSDPMKTPFEFERQASIIAPFSNREPSIYVSDIYSQAPAPPSQDSKPRVLKDQQGSSISSSVRVNKSLPPDPPQAGFPMPLTPLPPASKVLEGLGSKDDLKDELHRMIESMNEHLKFASGVLEDLPVSRREGGRGKGMSRV